MLKDQNAKPQLVQTTRCTCFGPKKVRRLANAPGALHAGMHWLMATCTPQNRAFGSLVSSLVVLQSMEVPLRRTSFIFSIFPIHMLLSFFSRANPLVAT